MKAVSYTHLDVYKRQIPSFAGFGCAEYKLAIPVINIKSVAQHRAANDWSKQIIVAVIVRAEGVRYVDVNRAFFNFN